jgi:tetratricopeptide (TPR) repeat protein
LDYFKIENIKNEIGSTAAIENLQLDKYGQIIELLADFSLILPDIKENQEIVRQEIQHQIKIYQIDENPFALFLERIMQKYIVTVNKKIKEKIEQDIMESMKTCPRCAEKVLPKAKVCKHCGYNFKTFTKSSAHRTVSMDRVEKGKALYKDGKYDEAIEEFSSAIQLKSNYAIAYYNRAIAYNKVGNYKQAEQDLREASYLGHKKSQDLLKLKKIE